MFGWMSGPPTRKLKIEELTCHSSIKWHDGTFKQIDRILCTPQCDFFTIWTIDRYAWSIKAGTTVEIME